MERYTTKQLFIIGGNTIMKQNKSNYFKAGLWILTLAMFSSVQPIAARSLSSSTTHSSPSQMPPSPTELGKDGYGVPKLGNMKMIQEAWNDKEALTDSIVHYDYKQDTFMPIAMRVLMASYIVLPKWEEIDYHSIGNTHGFKIQQPRANTLIVQGIASGIDSDLRIVGKYGDIYNFYLRNLPVDSEQVPNLTVYVNNNNIQSQFKPLPLPSKNQDEETLNNEDKEPLSKNDNSSKPVAPGTLQELEKAKADYLKLVPTGKKFNWMRISGAEELAPKAAFNDGIWTYLDYSHLKHHGRAMAISEVVEGHDYPITQSEYTDEGFLIIKSISREGFTLRNQDTTVCIRPI